jgi:hypothetical protein
MTISVSPCESARLLAAPRFRSRLDRPSSALRSGLPRVGRWRSTTLIRLWTKSDKKKEKSPCYIGLCSSSPDRSSSRPRPIPTQSTKSKSSAFSPRPTTPPAGQLPKPQPYAAPMATRTVLRRHHRHTRRLYFLCWYSRIPSVRSPSSNFG